MRVRIIKSFYYLTRNTRYKLGDVVDVRKDDAILWLHNGIAMIDKSLDGAKETKRKIRR